MIQGTVSTDLTPMIELTLVGVDPREEVIVAAIDTGFNGALTLPAAMIQSLGWRFQLRDQVTLADESKQSMPIFRGIVLLNANFRIVDVLLSEVGPLVGLALIEGKDLRIHVVRGGKVAISEREQEQSVKQSSLQQPVIGLVGGMGSGKSRVAEAFAKRGAVVVSADAFGHEALEQPEILARIAQRWGDRVLDQQGTVDRKKMGSVVFASPVERANLELLVFPWIEKRIRDEIARAQANPKTPFIVLDAAIMLEAGWKDACDKIVYIHAPRAVRIERLQAHRGWTADDVANRETAQLPLSAKASRADVAVDNSGSTDNTQKQVDDLINKWGLN